MFQRVFHPRIIALITAFLVMACIWKGGAFIVEQEGKHTFQQKQTYYLHQLDSISQSLEENFRQIQYDFVPLYELGLDQKNEMNLEIFYKISKKIVEIQPAVLKILFFSGDEVKFGYPIEQEMPIGAKLVSLPRSHQFYITEERIILRYPFTTKRSHGTYFVQFELDKNTFFLFLKQEKFVKKYLLVLARLSGEPIWSNQLLHNEKTSPYLQVLTSQPLNVMLIPHEKIFVDTRVEYFILALIMCSCGILIWLSTKNGLILLNQHSEMKEKLKVEEDKLKLVTNILPIPILITREDGVIEFFNQEFSQIFGLNLEVSNNFNITNIYSNPLERFHILETLQTDGRLLNYPIQMKRADTQEEMWVALSVRKIILNNRTAFVSSLISLEELKNIEQKLQKTENHLQTLFASMSHYVVHRIHCHPVTGDHYEIGLDLISPSVTNILGLSDDEIYDVQTWKNRIHPQESEQTHRIALNAVSQMQPFECSFRWYHQIKRRWIYIKVISTPIFDEVTGTLFYNGIIFDVTDQKIEEERLEQGQRELERAVQDRTYALTVINSKLIAQLGEHQYMERKLLNDHFLCQYVFDNAPLLILTFDQAQQICTVNHMFSEITGFHKEQLHNTKVFYYLLYPDQNEREKMQVQHEALKHREIDSFVSYVYTKNGVQPVLWLYLEPNEKLSDIFFGILMTPQYCVELSTRC